MALRAVVFDFDGVLANSEPLHLAAFQQALLSAGIVLTRDAYYSRYLGFDDVGVFREVLSENGKTATDGELTALLEEKATAYDALATQPDVIYPGAADCVRRLAAAVPLAIASGALAEEIETILARSGLREYFPVIVAAGSTKHGKPSPDPYVRALELLVAQGRLDGGGDGRTLAASSVAIEDSRWGLASAQAAGMRTVGITTSYAARDLPGADLIVNSLDEVTVEKLASLCTGG